MIEKTLVAHNEVEYIHKKLKIIATPIGTLADLSPRAQLELKNADVIFCEDTRKTHQLLNIFQIKSHLVSLHLHNEKNASQNFLNKYFFSENPVKNAVLVSDAGTPGVCDPGAIFVNECLNLGIQIENIPGPSSLACALASNGFLQPQSLFVGFFPRTQKELIVAFNKWVFLAPVVVVGFESPQRIEKTILALETLQESHKIQLCLHREMSKKFEEHIRGTCSWVLEKLSKKKKDGLKSFGECVLSIEILNIETNKEEMLLNALKELQKELETSKISSKELSKNIAQKFNISSKELFNAFLQKKNESQDNSENNTQNYYEN
jgi:16S rRNA (cytidine1402-2'-O)-methyltransferase